MRKSKVTKHVEIPQLQIVEKTTETSKIQMTPGTRTSESCGIAPVCQMTQVRHVEVKSRTSSRDYDTGRTAGIHEDMSADRPKAQMSTSIVQELKSKFEAKQKGSQVPNVQRVQKTVEVPRVQYIDKVADIPLDVQRQGSTNQAPQYIDEVVDVPVPTQSIAPTIPDTDDLCLHETADEDGLEHENKKRKTLIVNIASGDEAEGDTEKEQEMTRSLVQGEELMVMDETDAQGPEHEMVQAMHAQWVQELRDVKNELMHVRELVGVLVRRERSAENKAEVAARRLDRMEREQTEADDAEHEANLQEALANQSKAVKVVVDKWFVDKGYGFGKAPKGEIVFIHASAVQGAEVLTIGTDAWVQVVNDDARAQGGVPSKESLGPKRVEGREGQREREQGGPTSKASSGTDCRTGSSVREEDSCGVRPAAGA